MSKQTIAEAIEISSYILNNKRVGVYYDDDISAHVVVSEEDYRDAHKLPAADFSHWAAGAALHEIPERLVEYTGFDTAWSAVAEGDAWAKVCIVAELLTPFGRKPNEEGVLAGMHDYLSEPGTVQHYRLQLEELEAGNLDWCAATLADYLDCNDTDGWRDLLDDYCGHFYWSYKPTLIKAFRAIVDEYDAEYGGEV